MSPSARGGRARKESDARDALTTELKEIYGGVANFGPRTVPLLAGWLLDEMTHRRGRFGSLAQSTARGALFHFATVLVDETADIDLLSVGEEVFEGLYSECLDIGSEKTANRRLLTMVRFHSFLERTFGVPEVDWFEVAPSRYGVLSIDANLILPHEYRIAQSLLEADTTMSASLRRMARVALAMLYKLFRRPGEIMRLTVADVAFLTSDKVLQGVLYSRNGLYGKLKCPSAVRQCGLGTLDERETELLEALMKDRLEVSNGDQHCVLFSGETDPRHPVDRRMMETRIREALVAATGDQSSRLYHLRHGCITLSALAACSKTDDTTPWQGIVSQDGRALGSACRQMWLGRPEPTRRILHQISSAGGHSVESMLTHYFHAFEWELASSLTTCFEHLQPSQLVYSRLLGVSYSNLRQLMARFTSGSPLHKHPRNYRSAIPSSVLRTWIRFSLSGVGTVSGLGSYQTVEVPSSLPPARTEPPRLPSADDLIALLRIEPLRPVRHGLSERFQLRDQDIDHLLRAAESVQRDYGFRVLPAGARRDPLVWAEPPPEAAPARLYTPAARKAYDAIRAEVAAGAQPSTKAAIDIWLRSFKPEKSWLTYESLENLRSLISAFCLLGLRPIDLQVVAPKEMTSAQLQKLQDWAADTGLPQHFDHDTTSRTPVISPALRVGPKHKKTHPVTSLHSAMLLGAIVLRMSGLVGYSANL